MSNIPDPQPGRRDAWRQHLPGLLAALALLTLCSGYVVADSFDKVPGFLTTSPRLVAAKPYGVTDLARQITPESEPLLESFDAKAKLPTAVGIEKQLAPAVAQPILGGAVAVSVFDMVTGRQVYSKNGAVPIAPASSTKILTATAALTVLGPQTRLATTTRLVGDSVYLVAGGDVTLNLTSATPNSPLSSANLDDLAAQTANSLRLVGKTSVQLRLDTSLFTGPMTLPTWDPSFVTTGIVSPVTPIATNIGRTQIGVEYSPRHADPALAAAVEFAAALTRHGVTTSAPVREVAPAAAVHLAKIESPPLVDIIDYMLKTSDNTIAETMGHLVAIKSGKPGDFANAGPAVVAAVSGVAAKLKIETTGLSLADSSGLSNLNRITPDLMARLVMASYHRQVPNLESLALDLPSAGFSGTLAERFKSPNALPLDGVLFAKTGTLRGILSLTGYVPDADGRLLAFSVVVTSLPDNVFKEGQGAVDQIGVALAACGCHA